MERISYTLSDEFGALSAKNILDEEETAKAGEECVEDLSSTTNKHEPLDASQGARIMAREVGVSILVFSSLNCLLNLAPIYKGER